MQVRSESTQRRARLLVLSAGLLSLIFLAGAYLAPAMPGTDLRSVPVPLLLKSLYSAACHQLPERSLAIAGTSAAVCARCSGLYLGGAVGLLAAVFFLPRIRRRLRPSWLAWALAPTAVDIALHLTGLPSLTNLPRLALALPLGLVAGMFLALGLADLAAGGGTPAKRPERLNLRRYAK